MSIKFLYVGKPAGLRLALAMAIRQEKTELDIDQICKELGIGSWKK